MYLFKTVLFFVVMAWPVFHFTSGPANPPKWVLTRECRFKVNGRTNINQFSCIIPEFAQCDTLVFNGSNPDGPVKMNGSMVLDLLRFDCHNQMMTSDLRKTLKVKTFPKLIIRFLNLSKYPDPLRAGNVTGTVAIELAGVVKKFDVSYTCTAVSAGNVSLTGSRQLNFSDFDLVPPRKLGGMIKTDNELNVEFILNARILN